MPSKGLQRPAPAARASGHEYRTHYDYDEGDYLTVPLEIDPSASTNAPPPSVAQGPATAYAHGDANAPVPNILVTPRPQSAPRAPLGQSAQPSAPNISAQIHQLVQARNAANSAPQSQPRLQTQNMSLADLARQVRAEKANEEKAKLKIKQDAEGHAILVEKNP
ncbi:MAG TPA: hypothetical protein VEG64_14455 [Candidatus Sulfotelmatobacter sp.]|nr:hypothetical protein [Candidatus Sulfotelmatobacter sp.]